MQSKSLSCRIQEDYLAPANLPSCSSSDWSDVEVDKLDLTQTLTPEPA